MLFSTVCTSRLPLKIYVQPNKKEKHLLPAYNLKHSKTPSHRHTPSSHTAPPMKTTYELKKVSFNLYQKDLASS